MKINSSLVILMVALLSSLAAAQEPNQAGKTIMTEPATTAHATFAMY